MTVFTRQIATAKRMIAAKGEDCIWRTPAPDGELVDPDRPWQGRETAPPVDTPVRIVWTKDTREPDPETGEERRAMAGLMAGDVAFEPKYGDTVIRPNGDIATLGPFDRIAPDGTPILYEMEFSV